jgi:UDP:flavonoid glycosyltransferase YjiC (YdhE family)
MRVLFATWAQTGHYQPLVPLGWALRAAGHDVAVLTHPPFAPVVTGSGLPAVPVGPDIDVTALLRERYAPLLHTEAITGAAEFAQRGGWAGAAPGRPGRLRDQPQNQLGREMLRIVLDGCLAMLDDAYAFATAWRPDLVVYEPTGFLGGILATVLGVPGVRVLWAPDFSLPMQTLSRRLFAPVLERFGVPDVDITGTLTLDPCPARMQVSDTRRRRPMRYIGYPGPLPVAPPALTVPGDRPRVCVTWGTTIHGLGIDETYLAPDVLRALSGRPVEIVLAVAQSQLPAFGELPPGVVHAGPVPLLAVLPACDAVVHQGGGGTTMSSVLSGVPQLAVPTLPDTEFNAGQMAQTGAGIALRSADAGPAEIGGSVRRLLDEPRYREAATRLRDEARAMPTPAETVGVLEDLAARPERSRIARSGGPGSPRL